MLERLKKHTSGFTLIELLVVIAIIGILAGIVLVSFTGIQGRARDGERISDVRQAVLILQSEGLERDGTALTGCTSTTGMDRLTTCSGPGDVNQFNTLPLTDPSGSTTACTSASAATCDYGISGQDASTEAPQLGDNSGDNGWQICFYLENGTAGLSSGLSQVRSSNSGQLIDAQTCAA